jgi:hypothetical protein
MDHRWAQPFNFSTADGRNSSPLGEVKIRHAGAIVTPVKTGVHPHPQNLDTVFQRYDGKGMDFESKVV